MLINKHYSLFIWNVNVTKHLCFQYKYVPWNISGHIYTQEKCLLLIWNAHLTGVLYLIWQPYCKAFEERTFPLISPRHLGTYLSVFLQGRAQPSESFSGSVINKGISRLAFPSAGCLGCQCYLSKQPTYWGIKLQISTVPPNLYNQSELGKTPALKKCTEPTFVTREIRG